MSAEALDPEAERRARKRELTQTVPQEAFSSDGLQRHAAAAAATPAPSSGTVPMLAGHSLSERLALRGMAPGEAKEQRFEVERVLGIGATGRVYAVRDHNLERPVAVKFLAGETPEPDEVRHFIQEAQITASLEHPNVLPVHELDINAAGQVYFSMKQIDGRSLGAALEQSTPAARARPVESFNAIVNVFVGICQALAYAHDRGVVHQDIKPDNIMLGDYGEVLLVDWGSAIRLRAGEPLRLYGTPLFMSPEQARSQGVDQRSDVYCLGATLFNALTLRHPTWSDDPERFWAMKRAGEISPLTSEERAATPPALLDIALKALAPEPAGRYQGAVEMLRDLQAYQAGLAVSAHRDSLLELLARWHRRHARAIWSSLAAAAVVAALAGMLYGERLKEMATWGPPVLDETFADDSWRQRWKPLEGEFTLRDGRLVSSSDFGAKTMCMTRFEGATAIEYDAEILPDAHPCDLSVLWARDLVPSADGTRIDRLVGEYRLQVGAFDGSYTAILRNDGPEQPHLAIDDFHPVPGQVCHVRVEIVDNRLTLAVDGVQRCEWLDPIPFTGGYLGLYGYYAGKAFDNVRIYSRRLPQKVPATAIGDAFAREELWDKAVKQYERVAISHPGTELAEEALYREGLCHYRHGDWADAFTTWEALSGTAREELVRLHRLERTLAGDDHDRALADMETLYRDATPPTRKRIAMAWAQAIDALRVAKKHELVRRYLEVHDRVFPDQRTVDYSAANALLSLARNQEILDRYPRQRLVCSMALAGMGRPDLIVDGYPDQMRQYALALFLTGRSAQIDAKYNRPLWAMGLVKRGHAAEVVERYSSEREAYGTALLALGRLDDIPRLMPNDIWPCGHARLLQGRFDEVTDPALTIYVHLARGDARQVVAEARPDSHLHAWARHQLGIEAWARGDHDEARRWFEAPKGMAISHPEVFFLHQVVAPFLEGLGGDGFAALDRSCADVIADRRWFLEQCPWHEAMYLTGRIDDQRFLAMPHALYMDAILMICRAMRHERAGEGAAALADYRDYLALPLWRRGLEINVALNRFVEWRAQELAR